MTIEVKLEANESASSKSEFITIDLIHDDKAGVWTAASDDVPGLILEADSVDALKEKVKAAVPELLELNSDIFIPIPDDIVNRLNWRESDILEVEVVDDSLLLKKT